MRNTPALAVSFVPPVVAVSLACLACVSNSSGAGPIVDSGAFDATFAGDGSVRPLADATDEAVVACASSGLEDGACNALSTAGSTSVTGTCPTGTQPAGTGGAVVGGTYVLSAQARYVDAGCMADTFQAVMVIEGDCSERLEVVSGGTTLARNSTFETNGNVLTRTATCGASLPAATYTATPAEIIIFDQGGSVTTWTKQ